MVAFPLVLGEPYRYSAMNFLSKIFTWWNGATIGTHWWSTRVGGEHVGTDAVGAERNRILESHRPGVADGVVHVRPWVVHDGAGQAVVVGEVHAVDEQPVLVGESGQPGGGPPIGMALGHVNVHADAEVAAWEAQRGCTNLAP